MKVIIVSNTHPHYDRTGEIVRKEDDGRWRVRIPNEGGTLETLVRDKDFREIKRQDDTAGTRSPSGRYQADGLGCVEKVSGVERDWDQPRASNPYGY